MPAGDLAKNSIPSVENISLIGAGALGSKATTRLARSARGVREHTNRVCYGGDQL